MDFTKKMFGFKNPFSGGPTLAAACGSDQGKRRKNNEDNLYFKGFRMPEGTEGPEDYMPSDNHGSEVVVEKEHTLSQDSFFCVFVSSFLVSASSFFSFLISTPRSNFSPYVI